MRRAASAAAHMDHMASATTSTGGVALGEEDTLSSLGGGVRCEETETLLTFSYPPHCTAPDYDWSGYEAHLRRVLSIRARPPDTRTHAHRAAAWPA